VNPSGRLEGLPLSLCRIVVRIFQLSPGDHWSAGQMIRDKLLCCSLPLKERAIVPRHCLRFPVGLVTSNIDCGCYCRVEPLEAISHPEVSLYVMTHITEARRLAKKHMDQLDATAQSDSKGKYDHIEALCGLATSSELTRAQAGTDALFHDIVEPLSDRFEDSLCEIYIELFAQVIDYCRRLSAGCDLDRKLSGFGINDQSELRLRAIRVRNDAHHSVDRLTKLRKILVLSRVTLGADVAVTSVVLAKMKRFSPDAEIKFVGGVKAASFFVADSRIDHLLVGYKRDGVLLDRLHQWVTLTEMIEQEIEGLKNDEFLIVDPDSRLTQLGMLPLTHHDAGYCFLETRSLYLAEIEGDFRMVDCGEKTSLGQLVALQLQAIFGQDDEVIYPNVHLASSDYALGGMVREACDRPLAAINLGVGSNETKRVSGGFEFKLLELLIKRNYGVLLDRGVGEEESRRMNSLEKSLIENGYSLSRIHRSGVQSADVMTWEGSLSSFAGLIGVSDLYVGYDSAGGHLASALGVPVITVFAGAPNQKMQERWSPWGCATTNVVSVSPNEEVNSVLGRVEELLL
jgi:ADP-heptose:LPS heptosyltransferase